MTTAMTTEPAVREFPSLPILETGRVLRIARGGRLQPWLGPALRGLAGGRLKARVCRHPVSEQVNRWVRCAGCPVRGGCAYGETIEGDVPGADTPQGDGSRPIVIAPGYPAPDIARDGDTLPVRVTFLGAAAAGHASEFWEALRVGGADPGLGLGEDRVLFDVLPGQEPDRMEVVKVPDDPAMIPGTVARVRVVFTSPLVLKVRGRDGARRLVER